MMTKRIVSALVLCALLGTSVPTLAQTLYANGAGATFEIRFNTGYTTQRGAVILEAATWWADRLASDVTIVLDVAFDTQTDGLDLPCLENEALLGLGGTTTLFANSPGAPSNVAYPQALANALAGYDVAPGTADAGLLFNAKLDDPRWSACLDGGDWDYGFGPPRDSRDVSFYHTALHELAHGLGFQSYANFETGELFTFEVGGRDVAVNDAFLLRLRSVDGIVLRSLTANAMTDAQRAAAAKSNGNLVWQGAQVDAMAGILSGGIRQGKVQMYAPVAYRAGVSVSHFDTRLVPDELMEPWTAPTFDARLAAAAMHDLGWGVVRGTTLPPLDVGDSGGGAAVLLTFAVLATAIRRRKRQ